MVCELTFSKLQKFFFLLKLFFCISFYLINFKKKKNSRAKNVWVPVASMLLQRRGAACCGLDGKLYVAGGYQDGTTPREGFLKKVFVLTPTERDITKSSAMGRW